MKSLTHFQYYRSSRLGRECGLVDNISVMVVAEFPAHRGRELLRQCGFGRISIQSLLVFGKVGRTATVEYHSFCGKGYEDISLQITVKG
jgi:hypothetical protein